jgi:RHS repeat-associated protein
MTYDQMGNITKKSDVASTNWTYDTTHIHQVRVAGSNSYTYDANGNMLTYQGGASPIHWNSANYPTLLTFGGSTDTISYNQNRDRYYQQFVTGSGTETTYYAGGLLEKVTQTNGTVAWRNYVYAGNTPVAIVSRQNSATTLSYILKDHMGSVAGFLDSSGGPQVNESFRPFGVERSPTDWTSNTSGADTATIAGISRRGFTFQSTLTNPGTFTGMMVHLNGRALDGFIGRMLSPDPYIQDPGNTQDFNRYAYARNNPLTLTDPSGFDACIFINAPTYHSISGVDPDGVPYVGGYYDYVGGTVCLPTVPPGYPNAPGATPTPQPPAKPPVTPPPSKAPAPKPPGNRQCPKAFLNSVPVKAPPAVLSPVGVLATVLGALLSGDTPRSQRPSIYYHYGFASQASQFAGGIRPGGYGTPDLVILSGATVQQIYALPPQNSIDSPPDARYTITVPPGTPVQDLGPIGPTTYPGPANPTGEDVSRTGGGNEVVFPKGTPPGSVSGPQSLPQC